MTQLLDWRDIGRRIGKKLRDIINLSPHDDGPTKEERRTQRLWDVLKGFTYFDNFDEVLAWSAKEVDPIQRANTPLVVRSGSLKPKPQLVMCHDYKGGYHDYESMRPEAVQEELYTCEHMRYVDTFIYFSHKLVCVPPPSWTNALHRNGVKVLGTFIIEPQTPEIERMFTLRNGKLVVADILAKMACTYGFDGWLLNFEKEFASNSTGKVIAFIEDLKKALGDGNQVVWYDSLDIYNEVKYQNSLSKKNLPFAQAADMLFTNYKWTDDKLEEAKTCALEHNIDRLKICFGIDVWAQNTNMPGPPRITYPPEGGGGTNTGFAIKKLNETGFSSAVFGPAWTFEHFSIRTSAADPLSIAKAVNRSLWEGAALPESLGCDCKEDRPHHTAYYLLNSITEHASELPSGSHEYFHTDFSRPFVLLPLTDENRFLPTLNGQAILPHLLPLSTSQWEDAQKQPAQRLLYGDYEAEDDDSSRLPRTLLTIYSAILGFGLPSSGEETMLNEQTDNYTGPSRLCLFKLSMAMGTPLSVRVRHARTRESRSVKVGFYAAFRSSSTSDVTYEYHALPFAATSMSEEKYALEHSDKGSLLVELGIYSDGVLDSPTPTRLLHLSRLSVLPAAVLGSNRFNFKLTNLRVIERGITPNQQKRLAWDWSGERDTWPDSVPWSDITGPFSHFAINSAGRAIGTAYAMEFPLTDQEVKGILEGGISFSVEGRVFGDLEQPQVETLLHL